MWFSITHVTGLKIFKMLRQNPRSCKDIQDPRSYQDFQDPRSCPDIQDEIKDLTKKFKMSRENPRSFQDIQEFKIFPRSWPDIQDVKRWVYRPTKLSKNFTQLALIDHKLQNEILENGREVYPHLCVRNVAE